MSSSMNMGMTEHKHLKRRKHRYERKECSYERGKRIYECQTYSIKCSMISWWLLCFWLIDVNGILIPR